MIGRLQRSALMRLSIAAVLGLLHALGVGLPWLWAVVVAIAVPRLGVRWLHAGVLVFRTWLWRRESGYHHSVAGIALDIEEGAGQMWISADCLQRALRQREDEAITLAGLAGGASAAVAHAFRANEGLLMLNVRAVVQYLAHMPRRSDPRVLRLRRYLEREVLYPAIRRAAAAATTAPAFEDSGAARH